MDGQIVVIVRSEAVVPLARLDVGESPARPLERPEPPAGRGDGRVDGSVRVAVLPRSAMMRVISLLASQRMAGTFVDLYAATGLAR